ncbi:hypothetical protein [Candidatus Pantoea formicae]|uniref:hypothetical protein n=1 Tax=Candidatus Pantoea formicae TaxID=2608355 RepID=UPI003ED8B070
MEYNWPDDGKLKVSCPTCNQSISISTAAKELNSPLHPAHCENCNTEFDLYHDGEIEITFVPPEKISPEGKAIKRIIENMVFDPNLDEDDTEIMMETITFVEMDEFNKKLKDGKAVVRVESWMTDEQIGKHLRHYFEKAQGAPVTVWYDVIPDEIINAGD